MLETGSHDAGSLQKTCDDADPRVAETMHSGSGKIDDDGIKIERSLVGGNANFL